MKRIVLVEDERIVALALKHELTALGFEVVALASTAVDAVAATVKHQPDVILMDIMIDGDVDGIEAARQIAKMCSIPIVYLTGEADAATQKRALHSPTIFGYLLKPIHANQLAEVLGKLKSAALS
jgi:CheY-like chemotaxis protein